MLYKGILYNYVALITHIKISKCDRRWKYFTQAANPYGITLRIKIELHENWIFYIESIFTKSNIRTT